jgi:hypothetical protein
MTTDALEAVAASATMALRASLAPPRHCPGLRRRAPVFRREGQAAPVVRRPPSASRPSSPAGGDGGRSARRTAAEARARRDPAPRPRPGSPVGADVGPRGAVSIGVTGPSTAAALGLEICWTTWEPWATTASQSVARAVSRGRPLVAGAPVGLVLEDEVLDRLGATPTIRVPCVFARGRRRATSTRPARRRPRWPTWRGEPDRGQRRDPPWKGPGWRPGPEGRLAVVLSGGALREGRPVGDELVA